MTPELSAIVDEAYRVFSRYEIGSTLTVCHCNVCMTDDTELALVETPLREVPSDVLAEYTNSAHGWDDDIIAREMRHFLPRYFELIALDDPPDSMGLDICLRRIGRGGWRGKWPENEENLIDRFFDALVRSTLPRLELVLWPVGWRLKFDFAEVLTCIVTAEGNLERALSAWEQAENPAAAIHMAALRGDVLTLNGRFCLDNAFLEDHREAADKIGAFLMRPEVDARIEAAFFETPDPRLQRILSDATTQ
jgi:hypothetical protein